MKKSIVYLIIIIGCLSCFESAVAQEIKATVTVNMDQLIFENRNSVSSMESDIRNYINNQKFTNIEWTGDKIPVDISIYLKGGTNDIYSAQLIIISRRILDGPTEEPQESPALRIIETNWSFRYSYGASLTYNPLRFDELSSMIDFYMLLVIGFDLDSYNELGGSQAFSIAKDILQLGAAQDVDGWRLFSQPGELTKYNLCTELTDIKYQDLRRLFLEYYLDGLDLIGFKPEEAISNLANVIDRIAYFKDKKISNASVLLQYFFDTKAQEIASIFNGYPDANLWKNLYYLDPGNTQLYDDARSGKLR
jgi:hypothetical protein